VLLTVLVLGTEWVDAQGAGWCSKLLWLPEDICFLGSRQLVEQGCGAIEWIKQCRPWLSATPPPCLMAWIPSLAGLLGAGAAAAF